MPKIIRKRGSSSWFFFAFNAELEAISEKRSKTMLNVAIFSYRLSQKKRATLKPSKSFVEQAQGLMWTKFQQLQNWGPFFVISLRRFQIEH